MITSWKLAPAIANGNTLAIKTPEHAPLYGQKLAALICEAGFRRGVFDILCGFGCVVRQALAKHMDVKKLAFTGGIAVGGEILRASASTNLKKWSLELGEKGPSVVFSDANFDNALSWATAGITAHKG
jgi:aldehyde dehydrogenase (NAD+)